MRKWRVGTAAVAAVVLGAIALLASTPAPARSDARTSPAPGDQAEAAVAFDGTNYLVVWEDTRAGGHDIYGIRVSPSGAVLDTGGIPISTAANDQRFPQVAFDGTNFLVVWQDARDGTEDIYGARVSPTGAILDPGGIPISAVSLPQYHPRLAFGGTNYLVAFEDRHHDVVGDIYGARVSRDGDVLDPSGIPILTNWQRQFNPAVAFDGANFLVAIDAFGGEYFEVVLVPVTPDGHAGGAIRAHPAGGDSPALAFDGENFLLTWTHWTTADFDIAGARVTTSWEVLDPDGIPISGEQNYQERSAARLCRNDYLVAWQDSRTGTDIYGARVTPDGAVLDTDGIPIAASGNRRGAPRTGFRRGKLACRLAAALRRQRHLRSARKRRRHRPRPERNPDLDRRATATTAATATTTTTDPHHRRPHHRRRLRLHLPHPRFRRRLSTAWCRESSGCSLRGRSAGSVPGTARSAASAAPTRGASAA